MYGEDLDLVDPSLLTLTLTLNPDPDPDPDPDPNPNPTLGEDLFDPSVRLIPLFNKVSYCVCLIVRFNRAGYLTAI